MKLKVVFSESVRGAVPCVEFDRRAVMGAVIEGLSYTEIRKLVAESRVDQYNGNMTHAADSLGITPKTLRSYLG
ncbi:hypothetical protein KS4_23960 [Poriferisphaera corsica]|uniref:DNA binding HTH domain-containing protein n=1 Tax=Poriferisphaera corsica TaxID=2528020 RepID=A0A517YVS0_9BACT|nr:helix-turn-helix domain-containing protein [Poriferisphaera corsica]QDU34328.1 hypothetical protein KS4_23960 [Poriferisphaera corsica]